MENYTKCLLTASCNPAAAFFCCFSHEMQEKELLSIVLQRPEARGKSNVMWNEHNEPNF